MYELRLKGLDRVLHSFDLMERDLDRKLDEFLKGLAEIGLATASVGYSNFVLHEGIPSGKDVDWYETTPEINVTVEPIENGYAVVAEGREVLFVEFGAGVYYNGSEAYPGERPEGVVGIGQYGRGYGNRDAWAFDDGGGKVITRGNMPAAAMYWASEDIKRNIEQVAKEVFG